MWHPEREAGSTAVQEVAFTLANGIEYVQQAIQAGLDVDKFAGQISFFFNAHNNFLEEVAKFRAATEPESDAADNTAGNRSDRTHTWRTTSAAASETNSDAHAA